MQGAATLLTYGVHKEPKLTKDGFPILCAVGNDHRERRRVALKPGDDEADMTARLHAYLLNVDPPTARPFSIVRP